MAVSMRTIIKNQIEDLRNQGYSIDRAGKILETIDAAAKGCNVNEIRRVIAELKGGKMKTNPRTKRLTKNEKIYLMKAATLQQPFSVRSKILSNEFGGGMIGMSHSIEAYQGLQRKGVLQVVDRDFGGDPTMAVINLEELKTNPRKKKTRARYKHKDIRAASAMAKGSIRTKRVGKKLVRVGCPKGPRHYNKKTGRCKVGTRAVSVLIPNPAGKTFRVFAAKQEQGKQKYFYWNGDNFDSNYTNSVKMTREAAIRSMKSFIKKFPHIAFGVSDGKA